jgi:hypothetical protein
VLSMKLVRRVFSSLVQFDSGVCHVVERAQEVETICIKIDVGNGVASSESASYEGLLDQRLLVMGWLDRRLLVIRLDQGLLVFGRMDQGLVITG